MRGHLGAQFKPDNLGDGGGGDGGGDAGMENTRRPRRCTHVRKWHDSQSF